MITVTQLSVISEILISLIVRMWPSISDNGCKISNLIGVKNKLSVLAPMLEFFLVFFKKRYKIPICDSYYVL